jgi:hypothetical protein
MMVEASSDVDTDLPDLTGLGLEDLDPEDMKVFTQAVRSRLSDPWPSAAHSGGVAAFQSSTDPDRSG